MVGVDRLVAVHQIDGREKIQQLVRARAADDAVGIEAEGLADRFAQRGRRAVRIILEMRRRALKAAIAFGLGPSGVSFDDSLKILSTPGAVLLPGT